MSAPRVEIVPLASWRGGGLLAEYDASDDVIRVDARAVERVRERLGAREAGRFVACAVAHESFHRARPLATEAQAHAYARGATGTEPAAFERAVRE